ncbi:hypothetical protein L916_09057, partial [Phytophthora nicotianae]
YEQAVVVDALVVEGATTEFLLGEDWMLQNGVKIDFTACEMKWFCGDEKKIVAFSCSSDEQHGENAMKVRMVRAAKVTANTCRRVELAVAAPEGTTGLFMPARRSKTTSTRATWAPTRNDMEVLEVAGALGRDSVKTWLQGLGINKGL